MMKNNEAIREELYQPEIEQAALGAMLENDEVCDKAQLELGLRPEMFYEETHQLLCKLIYEVAAKHGGYVLNMNVLDRIRKEGIEQKFPGGDAFGYLIAISELAPVARLAMSNLLIVKSDFLKREAVRVAKGVIREAYSTPEDGEVFVRRVPQHFEDLDAKGGIVSGMNEAIDRVKLRLHEVSDGGRGVTGLSFGFPELEKKTGGANPGLTLIGGRPSTGKTSLEGTIVSNLCGRLNVPVGRVMLDMGLDMVAAREMSREARVSLAKLNSGYAGKRNMAAVDDAADLLKTWPMYCTQETDIDDVCLWARKMKRDHDIKLLTIDYIQLLTASDQKRDENSTITHVAEKLKQLSNTLGIPIYALSQLNRESEKAKRALRMSDLRGSGALEQAASQIWFLSKNEDFPLQGRGLDERVIRPIECTIAKNQTGGQGVVELWFYCNYFYLEDAHEDWKRPTLYERHERCKSEPDVEHPALEL